MLLARESNRIASPNRYSNVGHYFSPACFNITFALILKAFCTTIVLEFITRLVAADTWPLPWHSLFWVMEELPPSNTKHEPDSSSLELEFQSIWRWWTASAADRPLLNKAVIDWSAIFLIPWVQVRFWPSPRRRQWLFSFQWKITVIQPSIWK